MASTAHSSTEPLSGVQGAGTVDHPYDQGNAEEQRQHGASGTEPISGIQGKGTIDQPYDQGNAPGQASAPGTEPPSGIKGKGTVDEPYDQGNQPEQPISTAATILPTRPSPKDPLASPSTTHQGSGNPEMEPTKEQEAVIHESRERDEAAQMATSTKSKDPAKDKDHFAASKSGAGSGTRYEERDVSPGEMRDGTHVVTDGQKGDPYAPGKMNKLKDKFHFGRH